MRFQLIVFDWDGTLMDSEARIVSCIQAAFADLGEPPPSKEAARDVIGLGLNEAMAMLWPDGETQQRAVLIERYRHHFLRGKEGDSALFPGARWVLETLRSRGLLLAIATGKSRRGLERVLVSTGFKEYFHATCCADEMPSKPHPAMLQHLMAILAVPPERTLMIGDTEYDMQMARNAGVAALAVGYGVHSPDRLLSYHPLGCLSELRAIPGWLETLESTPPSTSLIERTQPGKDSA